jgi:pimeloyl-ACP methyl ester carboxylesterase
VEDVEAVRAALGADRLILYAASYGTKLALAYAAAYPQHVERLVLDSVVLPEGIDPFQRSTLSSIPRVLRAVCGSDCRFTRDPGAELAALARRLAHGGLRGVVFDGRGRPHRVRLSEAELLGLLLSGDFDRFLRAGLPAAIHSALAGDSAPLLRLAVSGGGDSLAAGSDSDVVYVATTCEDGQVPWSPGTPLEQRRAAVDTAAGAIPASAFLPFDRETVRALGTADLCRGWPESPIVQPAPPLPTTPTLILSGDDDLRTPRVDALALAGQLPGGKLLQVPDAGHGVLFSDPSNCAQQALLAFVGGVAPTACRHRASVVSARPLAPRRLAAVRRVRGVPRLPGRTIAATVLTIGDATEQLLGQLVTSGQAQPFGGLRAGSAQLRRGRGLVLQGYGYVPGVRVSGSIPPRGSHFTLTVSGPAAAHGRLTFSRRGVAGRLNGVPVHAKARALAGLASAATLAAAASVGRNGTAEAPSPLRPPVLGTGLSAPIGR